MAANKSKTKPDPAKATPKALSHPDPAADPPMADGIPVHCAHAAIVPIAQVRPYPANANRHPDDQVRVLAKLILANGWRVPITVSNQSGFVVRGHGRLAAARRLRAEAVPVDYQDYPNEAAEKADRAADNLVGELAEADRALLKELVLELDDGSFDLELLGQNIDYFEELMTAAPPPGAGSPPMTAAPGQTATGGEPAAGPTAGPHDEPGGVAWTEPQGDDRRSAAPLQAKMSIPPQAWLMMRERLIDTINAACIEFGVVIQWPE